MKYGNSLKNVTHVAKVGLVFALIIFGLLFFVGYTNNTLSGSNIWVLLGIPTLIGLLLPISVLVTTFLTVEIHDRNISLLVLNKYRRNTHSVDEITEIKITRSILPLRISFRDGSTIRTPGMYIPEIYRLVKDLRSITNEPLPVSSSWLSFD